ncbi:MAG: biopolymer transporter ExbD [Methylacidiphilales bacterium]|nr:biopolymer transporter ExbD [Candidatus Methylacidiphilales bacterium]
MSRRRSYLKESYIEPLDLAPMLDMVFNLLLFFILAANFIKETGIEVNKSSATTSETRENANILVAISGRNEVWIQNRIVPDSGLRPIIEQLHAENPQGALIIQADKDSKNDKLVKVMDAARQAGVYNISLSTVLP